MFFYDFYFLWWNVDIFYLVVTHLNLVSLIHFSIVYFFFKGFKKPHKSIKKTASWAFCGLYRIRAELQHYHSNYRITEPHELPQIAVLHLQKSNFAVSVSVYTKFASCRTTLTPNKLNEIVGQNWKKKMQLKLQQEMKAERHKP